MCLFGLLDARLFGHFEELVVIYAQVPVVDISLGE